MVGKKKKHFDLGMHQQETTVQAFLEKSLASAKNCKNCYSTCSTALFYIILTGGEKATWTKSGAQLEVRKRFLCFF